MATIAFVASFAYDYWEHNLRSTYHSRAPKIASNSRQDLGLMPTPEPSAHASHLTIESFTLNEELSSFKEENALLFARPGQMYRTFDYDNSVTHAFDKGECIGVRGNRPMEEVLPLLQSRLEKAGRSDLRRYIVTVKALSRVIQERGDIFAKIMFTPADLDEMQRNSPADYRRVREWLLNCIGLQQPVLTLTVHNTGTQSILLSKVIYDVLEVGQVMGGTTGPVIPVETYDHILEHVTGQQTRSLTPPLQIAAQDRVSFNLRLFSALDEPGLAWLLRIQVVAANGDSAMTEPVQIIMAK